MFSYRQFCSSSSRRCLRTHLRLLMDLTDIPSHRIACFTMEQQVSAEELLAEEHERLPHNVMVGGRIEQVSSHSRRKADCRTGQADPKR
ncbi:hypothetical protein TYRP_006486 [Tyrophagus putrescentiae]|nr:hypothetical protein TYRP_006486 [Tyrophagus putrescentiae]